jgi:branched-chain amino acid transport system substrate-binding protein
MKDYGEALRYLNQLQTEFPESDLLDRGKLMSARIHAAMGNIDLALPLLAHVRTTASDDATKREAQQLTAEILAQKKDYVRAIHILLEGMAGSSDAQMAETREQIRQFITEKLDKKGLTRVRDAYPRSYPGDLASLRLIDYYIGRGEDHLAERETRHFLAAFPAHPSVAKASESLELIKSRLKANQYFIAAVLPLSGHLSAFANDVLEGIQLAVERAREQPGNPSIGLIVKDHDADRQGFLDDLSTLLNDDRPLVVIGPMLSKNLPVMAEMAQKTRVPLITPAATLPNVRRLGNYLFSTSLTYAMQAERIATYAAKEQGYRRFCILHPDTIYGRELARLFAQEVRRLDGEIISIEMFKEGETDFGPQIQRLKAEDLKKYGLAIPVDVPRFLAAHTKSDFLPHNWRFMTSKPRCWAPTAGTLRTLPAPPIGQSMAPHSWTASSSTARIPPCRSSFNGTISAFNQPRRSSPCRDMMQPESSLKESATEQRPAKRFTTSS